MSNGQMTLEDLSAALRKHGASLELQLHSGGSECKAKVRWATRPIQLGASIGGPDTPRSRTLEFTGSLKDVTNTITAWAQEELPVTYYPSPTAES